MPNHLVLKQTLPGNGNNETHILSKEMHNLTAGNQSLTWPDNSPAALRIPVATIVTVFMYYSLIMSVCMFDTNRLYIHNGELFINQFAGNLL